MHEELGITEDEYSILKESVGEVRIYSFCTDYGSRLLGLYYYIDVRGRFIPVRYKQDEIAKAIFDGLSAKEKMAILQYMEDLEDDFRARKN